MASSLTWAIVTTPLGRFAIGGTEVAITTVLLPHEVSESDLDTDPSHLVGDAARQLDEFVTGTRRTFDLALSSEGTVFQEAVWQSLSMIDYGEIRSYGWVGDQVGSPKGPRAVGQALGKNPIPIFRPCHRVVGASGLGGYGGGLALKRALLELEGVDARYL
ncbi:unannotated protein [freshwater metagenome]|uniref:methylated-DNA--[protein]-cysteine S-methyltransferase n=1 Tax=freshwater metagenome TaxID=449393 RepID=A0A6J7EBT0_9ZZZZ